MGVLSNVFVSGTANSEHVEVVRQGAEAIRKWRAEHPEEQLFLKKADLQHADLVWADLQHADLVWADLQHADLENANLQHANLHGANLQHVNLAGANLQHAHLTYADLQHADLGEASLQAANLQGVNLQHADLTDASLSGALLDDVKKAERAYALETVRLNDADVRDLDQCIRPWPERWLDWERLRTVGRLPLFGASYTALILIPIVFYGLALYNDKIALLHAWAVQAVATPEHPFHRLATLVVERLQPQPIPRLSLVLLVSTVLLAMASTLYTLCCPSRIKEFSRDQWCDQLRRSLLHYWAYAWKYRWIRLLCALCYVLGGAGALWVIGSKVWETGVFIVKRSVITWPWQ